MCENRPDCIYWNEYKYDNVMSGMECDLMGNCHYITENKLKELEKQDRLYRQEQNKEKDLITIAEHNTRIREKWEREKRDMYKTGIKCPKCGNELEYINPYNTLLGYPPKKWVKCNCGFETTVLYDK